MMESNIYIINKQLQSQLKLQSFSFLIKKLFLLANTSLVNILYIHRLLHFQGKVLQ